MIFALLIAALIALPGCDLPRPAPTRPALFVVRDADTVIWLLGTIHALPPGATWETPAVTRAIEGASSLVTEIPRAEPGAVAAQFEKLAHREGLPPIDARVPARFHPALARAAKVAGNSTATLDALETWAAAVTLASGAAQASGASAGDGVEAVLARRFAGRPQRGFETAGSQLALFDQLSEPDQRRLLTQTITEPAGYQIALAAWSAGDLAAMARSNDRLFAGAPALEAALLTGRNARWSRWIALRMRQPGTVLVAVGAGHLAGPQSVVAMLRRAGLSVRRVQ
jgi:hypothetical protein